MKRIVLLLCVFLVACSSAPSHLNVYDAGNHSPLGIARAMMLMNSTPEQAEAFHFASMNDSVNRSPVIMVPGLGLSPVVYTFTPDARPGWAYDFREAGHDVYAYNPVRNADEGELQSPEEVWTQWGFGPSFNTSYTDSKFPSEYMQNLEGSFSPYQEQDDPLERESLTALLNLTGPAHVITHSTGGPIVFSVAENHPALVRSVVGVEPVSCPVDLPVPFMAVYGDYIEDRDQTARKRVCTSLATATNGSVLSLPEENVSGNSHLLMVDTNSADIADRIMEWIAAR